MLNGLCWKQTEIILSFLRLHPTTAFQSILLFHLIFPCHIFLPFHAVHGVPVTRILSGLPFPPLVGHILLEVFIMTCPYWVALHGMSHSFVELCKPLHHDKVVIREGIKKDYEI